MNSTIMLSEEERFTKLMTGKEHGSLSISRFTTRDDGNITETNLGEWLEGQYDNLKEKISYLNLAASALQVGASFRVKIGKIISLKPHRVSQGIFRRSKQAEPFGNDLDKVYNGLLEIKKELSREFGIIW